MSLAYLSEIRLVGFGFAPVNWALCNGQSMSISQFQALFSLLGTLYGGDGVRTFLLPNLQGAAPIHFGNGFVQGQTGGEVNHTLALSELPGHNHSGQGVNAPQNSNSPTGNLLANTSGNLTIYGPLTSPAQMFPADISNAGGGQPHPNQSPFLVMTWIICLSGIFPSQN
jgi:microcystin-dependent protein